MASNLKKDIILHATLTNVFWTRNLDFKCGNTLSMIAEVLWMHSPTIFNKKDNVILKELQAQMIEKSPIAEFNV